MCRNYVCLNFGQQISPIHHNELRSVTQDLPVQWLAAVIYAEARKRKPGLDILPSTVTRLRMHGVSLHATYMPSRRHAKSQKQIFITYQITLLKCLQFDQRLQNYITHNNYE